MMINLNVNQLFILVWILGMPWALGLALVRMLPKVGKNVVDIIAVVLVISLTTACSWIAVSAGIWNYLDNTLQLYAETKNREYKIKQEELNILKKESMLPNN